MDTKQQSKHTHTAGPWRVGEYINACKKNEELWIHATGQTSPVCSIASNYRRDYAQADARLIAAAPEMLEACKAAVGWLTHGNVDKNTQKNLRAVSILNDAITQAEGSQ